MSARVVSITTLWFTQKERKLLPPVTFHGLKICRNVFAAGTCRGSLQSSTHPLSALQRRGDGVRGRLELTREGRMGEGKGRLGKAK